MISVVLCGGAGARLWPLSRERHPKPFLPLPTTGRSLIQEAYLRAASLPQTKEILTVTNRALYFQALDAYKSARINHKAAFILEPFGRNTAPAIAAATMMVNNRLGPETLLLILAADHLIADQAAFAKAVDQAQSLARQDFLVAFGLKPTRPETGYGYIEAEGSRVRRFVEKPDLETAKGYQTAGNFYWNAGLFCFTAGAMIRELERWAEPVLKTVAASLTPDSDEAVELRAEHFAAAPDISIDYAVLEKSDRVAVVPCDLGWSDIGSWNAFCGLGPADVGGNHLVGGSIMLEDVTECNIHGSERLVAALGVENLLIVDTPDALLVTRKDRADDIKKLYHRLKTEKREEHRYHRTVHRPWGSYTLLECGSRFKIKRMDIKPGGVLSLQRHHHRSEHWVVVSGLAEVTCDDRIFLVDTNESTYFKAGRWHRVSNRGLIDLVIIEVQSGDYLGEDDIVRTEDIYGRAPAAGAGSEKRGMVV